VPQPPCRTGALPLLPAGLPPRRLTRGRATQAARHAARGHAAHTGTEPLRVTRDAGSQARRTRAHGPHRHRTTARDAARRTPASPAPLRSLDPARTLQQTSSSVLGELIFFLPDL